MKVIKFSEFETVNEGKVKEKLKEQWVKFKAACKSIKKDFKFDESDFNFKDLSDWLDDKKSIKQILASKSDSKDTSMN